MALVPDSTSLSLGVNSTLAKATRAISSFLSPQPHSAEYALMNAPLRDARLAPQVPMDNAALDVGLLAQLSNIGMKRAKQVTAASHPELMRAWSAMSQRAGMETVPQLIIAESDTLNALTISPQEVVITTGLLKILDLRETCAVLGHELGHATSEHVKPRVMWMGALGALGGFVGNEFGRQGGANTLMHKIGTKLPFVETLRGVIYPKVYANKASSLIGYSAYIAAGAGLGAVVARNISVRPTENDADAKGAVISGDPLGLASALQQLQAHSPRTSFMGNVARLRAGYPTTEKRVANLKQIAASRPMRPVLDQVDAAPAQATLAPQAGEPRFAVNSIASAERLGEVQGPAIT